ncbi:hypothetical protein [Paraburkholderia sp. J67]|uniref:hypothetical protein n=1 Tax=Paraburkholderia sp. J67 TaxID=2805435 RepID=UPI002ABE78F9|nr:hypothetical protein [Paraburkholderia sp. J67]
MSAPTIRHEWDRFESRVITRDAPAIQHSEMRIAFYSGFKAMLDLNVVIGQMQEDEGIAALRALASEARQFGKTSGDSAREDIDHDS